MFFENIKMKEPVQLGTITVKECGCLWINKIHKTYEEFER